MRMAKHLTSGLKELRTFYEDRRFNNAVTVAEEEKAAQEKLSRAMALIREAEADFVTIDMRAMDARRTNLVLTSEEETPAQQIARLRLALTTAKKALDDAHIVYGPIGDEAAQSGALDKTG